MKNKNGFVIIEIWIRFDSVFGHCPKIDFANRDDVDKIQNSRPGARSTPFSQNFAQNPVSHEKIMENQSIADNCAILWKNVNFHAWKSQFHDAWKSRTHQTKTNETEHVKHKNAPKENELLPIRLWKFSVSKF